MKQILVPTDFSEESLLAIRSASFFAEKMEANLLIFHVKESAEANNSIGLSQLMAMPELQKVKHSFQQSSGDDLITQIVYTPSDLIVMGSKGSSGVKGFILGSNAEKVAKRAMCPVIVLKRDVDFSRVKTIVFPTDMRPEQDEVLSSLLNIQELLGANVHLLKIYPDGVVSQAEIEKRLTDYARFHRIHHFTVSAILGSDEVEEILKYAESVQADMIAMATHNRQGLGKLFGGVISGGIVNNSQLPVWIKSIQ